MQMTDLYVFYRLLKIYKINFSEYMSTTFEFSIKSYLQIHYFIAYLIYTFSCCINFYCI